MSKTPAELWSGVQAKEDGPTILLQVPRSQTATSSAFHAAFMLPRLKLHVSLTVSVLDLCVPIDTSGRELFDV